MEGEPVYFGRGMDAVGATRTAFMGCDNIIGYPDSLVQNPPKHAMTWLAEEILPARAGITNESVFVLSKCHSVLTLLLHRNGFILLR